MNLEERPEVKGLNGMSNWSTARRAGNLDVDVDKQEGTELYMVRKKTSFHFNSVATTESTKMCKATRFMWQVFAWVLHLRALRRKWT